MALQSLLIQKDFTEVLAKSKNAFEHRSRNPQSKYYGTWQTTHTSVYDMRNKKVNVIVQEDGEVLEYTFNALTFMDEIMERLGGKNV